MLPFLNDKKRQDGGSAVSHIDSEGKIMPGESDNIGLQSACEDLINAIHNKDHKALADALKNALACLEG